jgi:hypothetical protein
MSPAFLHRILTPRLPSARGLALFLTVWLLLCVGNTPLSAQTEETASSELLENYFRDNEGASESDVLQYLEDLKQYRDNPLNLNAVTKEQLHSLHLLNDLQIENFIAYREQFAPLLNTYELQSIPGWDVDDVKRMTEFSEVHTGIDTRNTDLFQGFYKGQNDLLVRWGKPRLANNVNPDRLEGDLNTLGVRYRHTFDNRLRFGFTADKDAGEAMFRGSNPNGFDFYSAHIFVQNYNARVRALALGDYSARLGQGLLLQSGFSPGKSAETTTVSRGGRKINGYGAFGEVFFLRGAATTLSFGKHWEVTALVSQRRRDANITTDTLDLLDDSEIAFSALQSTGLHRLPTEIEDEGVLKEQMAGGAVTYQFKKGHVTANGLYLRYDKPWNPSAAPYRQYVFQGTSLLGTSVDYQFKQRNFFFFGETARSENGAVSAVNGLLFSVDRNMTLTAVHRRFAKDYQAVYANPFAEVTGAANEQGLFLGADVRWTRRWQMNFYADLWKHPWLRYQVDAPSTGREYLARVLWQKGRNFNAYALWFSETKQRNNSAENGVGLVDHRRERFRVHAAYKLATGIEMRSRLEWTTYNIQDGRRTQGFLIFQEALLKPLGSPVSGAFRYSIFDTDDFNSRVFAFENDLFSAVSIPAFAGKGSRYYLNLQWRINRWLRLEGRFEETLLRRAGSGTAVEGNIKVWKLQARVRW